MSEQEKNTTPAQNAAPAAPKPPKIDNAALKKAAAALREENNPQHRLRLKLAKTLLNRTKMDESSCQKTPR